MAEFRSVLLVNPPTPSHMPNKEFLLPPSLLYLAGTLQDAGIVVEIFDCNILYPWNINPTSPIDACLDALRNKILSLQPTVVGFGCLFSGQFAHVQTLSKLVKETDKTIVVATGGIHPTIFCREILEHCPDIDVVFLGEGEHQILEFCMKLKNGRDIKDIDEGIAFRNLSQIIVKQKVHFCENLDNLPPPAYNLVNFSDYQYDTSHWHNPKKISFSMTVPIITSRSCPNQCSFCSMFLVMGPKFRARSAKNVVEELVKLYEEYGIRHFTIMDDNFTFSKKRTLEICNLITRYNLDIQFETPNGLMITKLDDEVIDALVIAGWIRGAIAIESGSDYIRNSIMGKRLPREKIFSVSTSIRRYPQVYIKAYFIIGMPEETNQTLQESFDMISQLDVDDTYVTNVIPFPSTSLYNQCIRDGILINMNIHDNWCSDVFYYTDNKRFFIQPYHLSLSELAEWRVRFDQLLKKKRKEAYQWRLQLFGKN